MFIVMLVIVGLSAAGLFAVRASLTTLDSAGRHRQMLQTQTLAELGLSMSISEVGRDAQRYKMALLADYQPVAGERPCRSASPARRQCMRLGLQQLQTQLRNDPDAPLPTNFEIIERKSAAGRPSGLGFGDVRGNFGAEVIDVSVGPPAAGFAMSSITSTMSFYRFTITSTGQIIPTDAAGTDIAIGSSADAKFAASAVQARAHVLVGPLH